MIETIYIEVIILLLLVWVMGAKIFPQILLMFLTLGMMLNQIRSAEVLSTSIYIFIIYAGIIMYSGMSVSEGDKK